MLRDKVPSFLSYCDIIKDVNTSTEQEKALLSPQYDGKGRDASHGLQCVGKMSFAPALEGLRGIAVMLVMVSHVMPGKDMLGTLGVGIFFVLSGFLITGVLVGSLEKQREARTKSADLITSTTSGTNIFSAFFQSYKFLPRFYMDRFIRLTAALLFVVTSITFMCIRLGVPRSVITPDALSAFFYVHNWYPLIEEDKRLMRPGMFLNTWSLAVEEQFYIFWSLFIPLLEPTTTKKRAVILFLLISSSFTVRYYSGYAFLGPNMHSIDYRYAWSANVWKMFIGCSARLLPCPSISFKPFSGLLCTLSLGVLVYLWGWGLGAVGYDFRTEGAWLEAFTSIIVLGIILGSLKGNLLLDNSLLRFPGRISYSWYLWQFPLQAFAGWPLGNWAPTGLAFMTATFSTFIIEEPLRSMYRDFMRKKRHDL